MRNNLHDAQKRRFKLNNMNMGHCKNVISRKCNQKLACVRGFIVFILIGVFWILLEGTFNLRRYVPQDLLTNIQSTIGIEQRDPVVEIVFAPCTKIPRPPAGTLWAEEVYLNHPNTTSLQSLPSPKFSRIWLEGNPNLNLGDIIHVGVELMDSAGNRRTVGGDLVRVWIRDLSKGSAASANVIDNNDGSYSATTTAFWAGKPEVVAAIILPREAIAMAFQRRYMCPPITVNTAVFVHPKDKTIREETPCNYDAEVAGFKELCNLTADNFGRPWYCGQPRNTRLVCTDWTEAGHIRLINDGIEAPRLSPVEREMMLSLNYQTMVLNQTLRLTVDTKSNHTDSIKPTVKCNELKPYLTWKRTSPTGYLYKKQWTNRQCYTDREKLDVPKCIRGKRVIILGDSTTRQIYENIFKRINCDLVSDTFAKGGKHRTSQCVHTEGERTIYDISEAMHELPFLTAGTPRSYYRSLRAYTEELGDDEDAVLIIHLFSHFLNFHSHVYYEAVKELNMSLKKLIKRNKKVKIIVKGPHSYAFSKVSTALDFPQIYSNVHSGILVEQLKDVSERVYFLEALDITVSTEQWHIHAEEYIITELVDELFGFICPY